MSEAAGAMAAAASPANGTPGKGDQAKKKSDKDVDLNNANRGVWLVKVPKYIADRWERAKDGTDVGQLRIQRRAGVKPNVSFSLDDKIVAATTEDTSALTKQQIPKEHKFVVSGVAMQSLAVLSHTAGDKEAVVPVPDRLAVEGKVVQRAECRPISNNVYLSIKKEALLKPTTEVRKTVQLEKVHNAYKPVANHAFNKMHQAKVKAEGKKLRDDKEKVMEVLFGLFEKHQYYNIKDLVKETRQPVTYLKEVLKDVCVYNVKAPHKNMWELKPEYRHYKKEEKEEDEDGEKKKKEEGDSSDSD